MYQNPAVGTILPAQPNTSFPNPGPVHNYQGNEINEWLQAQAQANAYQKNQVLTETYTDRFRDSWLPNYQSGRLKGPTGIVGDPAATPPQPPPAFVVVVIAAETGGVNITFDVQPSGLPSFEDYPATGPAIPVCELPTYKLIRAPGQ